MTAVPDPIPDASVPDVRATEVFASRLGRLGAFAIDVLLGVAVVATFALVGLTSPPRGWLWWLCTAAAALTVVAMAINRWLLPTMARWSIGRALFGVRVVRRDGADAGVSQLLIRDILHLLDTAALFVGWLWPLWGQVPSDLRRPATAY
ncbi:RDD family protein [Mycobacterium sp. IS-3022]|uniref:RDD family protein n=1 Tax=Mycobacterium sp. IS-3022 TaxID=1772277 RepID=UPI000AC78E6F